jgi:hypothetical protein
VVDCYYYDYQQNHNIVVDHIAVVDYTVDYYYADNSYFYLDRDIDNLVDNN